MTRYSFILLAAALLFSLGGCSGDDPVASAPVSNDGDGIVAPGSDLALWQAAIDNGLLSPRDEAGNNLGATKLPFPNTPNLLMANFQTIYETQDVGEYLRIMHPDFLTILQQQTIEEFPDVGSTLDRREEQHIHKRMFSGLAVTDPNGDLVPGIQNIAFDVIQMMGPWEISPSDDIIPNAYWSLFEVQVLFDRGQSYSTLRVGGAIKFYLVSQEFEHEGVTHEFYQMIGQVDLTGGFKSTEELNWGSVKALFR